MNLLTGGGASGCSLPRRRALAAALLAEPFMRARRWVPASRLVLEHPPSPPPFAFDAMQK